MVKATGTPTKKTRWSEEEDAVLRNAVSKYPFKNGASAVDWRSIADITGRTTKQCRERWINVLDPSILRSKWTDDEIEQLFQAQTELGNKWSLIASRLPGRPETAVKNTFYAAVRREKRRTWARENGLAVPPPLYDCPLIPIVAKTIECAPSRSPAIRLRGAGKKASAAANRRSTAASASASPSSRKRRMPGAGASPLATAAVLPSPSAVGAGSPTTAAPRTAAYKALCMRQRRTPARYNDSADVDDAMAQAELERSYMPGSPSISRSTVTASGAASDGEEQSPRCRQRVGAHGHSVARAKAGLVDDSAGAGAGAGVGAAGGSRGSVEASPTHADGNAVGWHEAWSPQAPPDLFRLFDPTVAVEPLMAGGRHTPPPPAVPTPDRAGAEADVGAPGGTPGGAAFYPRESPFDVDQYDAFAFPLLSGGFPPAGAPLTVPGPCMLDPSAPPPYDHFHLTGRTISPPTDLVVTEADFNWL